MWLLVASKSAFCLMMQNNLRSFFKFFFFLSFEFCLYLQPFFILPGSYIPLFTAENEHGSEIFVYTNSFYFISFGIHRKHFVDLSEYPHTKLRITGKHIHTQTNALIRLLARSHASIHKATVKSEIILSESEKVQILLLRDVMMKFAMLFTCMLTREKKNARRLFLIWLAWSEKDANVPIVWYNARVIFKLKMLSLANAECLPSYWRHPHKSHFKC